MNQGELSCFHKSRSAPADVIVFYLSVEKWGKSKALSILKLAGKGKRRLFIADDLGKEAAHSQPKVSKRLAALKGCFPRRIVNHLVWWVLQDHFLFNTFSKINHQTYIFSWIYHINLCIGNKWFYILMALYYHVFQAPDQNPWFSL